MHWPSAEYHSIMPIVPECFVLHQEVQSLLDGLPRRPGATEPRYTTTTILSCVRCRLALPRRGMRPTEPANSFIMQRVTSIIVAGLNSFCAMKRPSVRVGRWIRGAKTRRCRIPSQTASITGGGRSPEACSLNGRRFPMNAKMIWPTPSEWAGPAMSLSKSMTSHSSSPWVSTRRISQTMHRKSISTCTTRKRSRLRFTRKTILKICRLRLNASKSIASGSTMIDWSSWVALNRRFTAISLQFHMLMRHKNIMVESIRHVHGIFIHTEHQKKMD